MNKLLILVLAICLVNVHAFVKRDATQAPENNNLEDNVANNLRELQTGFENSAKELFDPKKVKEALDSTLEIVNKALESLKPKEEPKA